MKNLLPLLLGLALPLGSVAQAAAPTPGAPDTVTVRSGRFALRGLLWRPSGAGRHPAVMFSHGSYSTSSPMPRDEPAVLGPVFAQHGYVFLFLFRQGIGLSIGQGTADGDLMARALAADGVRGRNNVQLALLEGEELQEALLGLEFLRALPEVDERRVALAGHSFGGALTLLLASRDTTVRAVVVFGAAAASWNQSPKLRARLLSAVDRSAAPVLFIHAANDYSIAPGEALVSEMRRLGKPSRLIVYPVVGRDARDGHNLVYRSVPTWELDVFAFLTVHVAGSSSAQTEFSPPA
jgi:dienelactone hydrolase